MADNVCCSACLAVGSIAFGPKTPTALTLPTVLNLTESAPGFLAGDEEESGGSWLSLLGIGQKTTYADE